MKHFSPDTDPVINFDKVDMAALEMLEKAREEAGIPFVITSHCRTPEHSVGVGGVYDSAHTDNPCGAFDIASGNASNEFKIIKGLIAAGFKRIGIDIDYKHVHCDNSTTRPQEVFFIERGKV